MSKTISYFISGLKKVVSDYRKGIALIDREFDEACERIGRSIDVARSDSMQYDGRAKTKWSQVGKLHRQAEQIEGEIERIEREITKLTQGITAVDEAIQAKRQTKTNLEQQIQNRWFFEKVYYFFWPEEDKDKERCGRMQIDLDKQATERMALEQTRRKFVSARTQKESEKKNFQTTLEEIGRKLDMLKKAAENASEKAMFLSSNRMDAEKRRQARKDRLWATIPLVWEKASGIIAQKLMRIRRQQPTFKDLALCDSPIGAEIPDALLLGSQQVSFKELDCSIPHIISFPFERALVLPEDNAAQRRLAHHLLLRLLQTFPPGRLELTLVDPLKQGQSVAPFLTLLNTELIVPQQRVLTRADEIESSLCRLTDEVEDLIQNRFKGQISDWTEFNRANPDNPLLYRILLLFDIPEQISDKSLWYLQRLSENGPRCGILPVFSLDQQRIEDRKYEHLRVSLQNYTKRLDSLLNIEDESDDALSFSYRPETWPIQEELDRFLLMLVSRYAETARFSKTLQDLWIGYAEGATTIDGFDVPVGWTPSGELASLTLGATGSEHHVLLAGKTGTGKSNLLHVLIHSLCEKYAPQEVDLYLLDYKESTEFTVYANPPLPHSRLVATESDSEYGVTVLQHLVAELERRAEVFKKDGVHDFAEYRKNHTERLPRVLLVVDEFQVLFSEGRQVAEMAEKLLSQLLKQGRSFGIHLLLATQTLKGINAMSIGALISQLGCRIALACGQEDSAMILGGNNWAAAELKSPPEGIINNDNGRKSGNLKFLIPLAENEFCRRHLTQLSTRAEKRRMTAKTRIFNGANLPNRPGFDHFRDRTPSNGLLLGERLTFTADPLVVPLVQRQAFNVLFCGYNDMIHDGLLCSTLASLAGQEGGFENILYFNGRGIIPGGGFHDVARTLGTKLKTFDDIGALPLQNTLDSIGKRRIALIIDGLDSEKSLHPAPTFRTAKPGEPLSPSDLLKRVADDGSRKGTFIFAFVDNWRRCISSCKELFNLFELRVGFCMNEDDAGTLVSGGVGKFKGIEKPNRAVYINRMNNEIEWFRPYIFQTLEGQ